jgi:hypothetical protein
MSRAFTIVISLYFFAVTASASPALEAGYRNMYDLNFPAAHVVFHDYEQANPADPLGPASDAAAYLFSEFDRLQILQSEFFANDSSFVRMRRLAPSSQVKIQFDAALTKATQLAEARLAKAPEDADAQFAVVMVHGLRSDYLGLVERNYLASLSEVKLGRTFADKLIMKHPDYADAYTAIGVENYLLGIKAAPIRWILRMGGAQTDKQAGIEKLRITADNGRYLKPFARLLLAVAALRDKDFPKAKEILRWLVSEFPHNHLYGEELAKLQ